MPWIGKVGIIKNLMLIFKEESNCSYKIRLLNLHVKKNPPKNYNFDCFQHINQPIEEIAKMEMQAIKNRKRDLIS